MVPDAATVAAVFAPRLADLIAPHALSLLVAPAEYRPGDLARAAMDELHGRDGYRSVRVPEDIPELLQALAERDPVIVEVVNDSFEVVDAMRVEITRHLGVLPSVERLVAVLVTDTIPDHVSDQPFTLVLDHRDLAATRDEVAATVPDIRGQAMLIGRVLNHTGGAAGLLHITDPESVGYPERVVQASIPWAERIHDEVTADDRLRTLLWCGRIATDTLATVLGELTGQRPSLSDLEALRGLPYVTAPAHLPPGLPRGLSVALQRLALERDPESTAALCRSLSGLVVTNERIRATDRILLATTLRDWEAINSILASKGYLLALAEREQLVWLGRVWPPRTASHLTHLARARRLVLGTWDHHVSTSGVPEHWHNFVHELRIGTEVEEGSLVGDVRAKLAELDAPRTFDVVSGRRELAEIVDALEVAVRNFEDQPAEETSPDDAALLGVLHLVMVDAAASIGEIALGQTCLRRAIRMAEHPAQGSAPVMLGAMLARGAFLAALDGQPAVAHARVAAFFENSRKVGEPRHVAKTLIRIAQRYPCMDSLNATDTVRRIDPESPFAPFSAEAEALRVLLVHGPGAAIDWATSMLSRGGLSTRPGWEWWPLHAFLALLSAREGRLSTARNWLDRSTFPPSLDLVVRAFVEFASGNRDRALSLVEELRARVDVPNRWRQIATGIWLAAQSQEENGTASRSIMVESQDWETALAPLALLPDAARALILPNLPPDLAELPGLVVGPDIEPPSEVRLTPRQIDILHALDTGRTMGEIGRSMYLSVETVRSTAKALYRRLGVNDRESALAAGRERGFL